MKWTFLRRLRQAAQILFFAAFIFLFFAALPKRAAFPLGDIFFRLNPLSALAAMLSAHAWLPRLGPAVITVVFTLALGRVWCSWVCPFGSLLEWLPFRNRRQRPAAIPAAIRKVKYFLLVMILAAALLGNLTLLALDPLALLTRSLTTVILPAADYGISSLEKILYSMSFLRPALNGFESLARGFALPVRQPLYVGSLFIALLFIAILAANALADRFWCRYLCPLGALLGWVSKTSFLRPMIGAGCNSCARCARVCQTGAIEKRKDAISLQVSECTV